MPTPNRQRDNLPASRRFKSPTSPRVLFPTPKCAGLRHYPGVVGAVSPPGQSSGGVSSALRSERRLKSVAPPMITIGTAMKIRYPFIVNIYRNPWGHYALYGNFPHAPICRTAPPNRCLGAVTGAVVASISVGRLPADL
jgi:hypothetical protein